jgi:hypothetical protein
MTLWDQYQEALSEWQAATAAFDEADAEFIDYQILRLAAAEEKLAILLRQAKQRYGENLQGMRSGTSRTPSP